MCLFVCFFFLVQSALHSCSFVLGKPVDYALARVRFGNRYIHATGFFQISITFVNNWIL